MRPTLRGASLSRVKVARRGNVEADSRDAAVRSDWDWK